MDLTPHAAELERQMDGQSRLAELAANDDVALMHLELADLCREQIVRKLLAA